ncbi:MAG: glycosyltransferase family 9 protein [Flavobacteriales bacterium]
MLAAEQWVSVVKSSQLNFVLLGGESEVTIAKGIADGQKNVENLAGKTSLHESAYLIKYAETVISGDTGFMHIAAAFNKPIISIWGCTSPSLQMSPYLPNKKNIILEPMNHPKRPCSKLGNKCKYGKGPTRCITTIEPKRILDALLKIQ